MKLLCLIKNVALLPVDAAKEVTKVVTMETFGGERKQQLGADVRRRLKKIASRARP
jgi:hypothetical protein